MGCFLSHLELDATSLDLARHQAARCLVGLPSGILAEIGEQRCFGFWGVNCFSYILDDDFLKRTVYISETRDVFKSKCNLHHLHLLECPVHSHLSCGWKLQKCVGRWLSTGTWTASRAWENSQQPSKAKWRQGDGCSHGCIIPGGCPAFNASLTRITVSSI